jgi:hypothetical protein
LPARKSAAQYWFLRGISVAKLSIYKYVRTDKGWRYCKAAFHPNGKIKPNVVVVSGVEEKHTEGRYFLNFNNQWIDAGEDALEAQRKRLLRLNQIEYERLSGTSLPASRVGHPSVVEFSGRKIIKDEVEAYLADLELTFTMRVANRRWAAQGPHVGTRRGGIVRFVVGERTDSQASGGGAETRGCSSSLCVCCDAS